MEKSLEAAKSAKAEPPPRGAWGNKVEFLLTCVGYSVGLGNIWRFPYLCYQNGGGAFLIPYMLMLILLGFPIFFLELVLGQFSSLGPITVWSISPLFKGVGCAMVTTSWLVSMYYVIIVAWTLHFLFSSFTSHLPWMDCLNVWNSPACIVSTEIKALRDNETLMNLTLAEHNLTSADEFKTPSEEYFYNEVLQMSGGLEDGGYVVWKLALCLLLAWLIIFLVLINGIKSLGKVVYFMSLFPYVMMTVLVIRGCTLEGAGQGLLKLFKPDLNKLADISVWSDAATMVFYSLSACSGGLIAMASYNDFHNNCYRDTLLIPSVTGFTSLYSGIAIFSVLGFMANAKGVNVEDVATQGPGLVFVVYPEAISQMPVPPVWSVLFFIMLLTLGLSSLFSIVESVFVAIMDVFPETLRYTWKRQVIFRGVSIIIFFFLTLPMVTQGGYYLFSLTDHFVSGFPYLVTGLFEIISVCYVYGISQVSDDIKLMLGHRPNIFFKVTWMFISPLILLVCIIAKAVMYTPFSMPEYGVLPDWALAIGWLQMAFTLFWIPAVAIVLVWRKSEAFQAVLELLSSKKSWGPANPTNRLGTKYEIVEGKLNQAMTDFNIPGSSVYSLDIEANKEYPTPYEALDPIPYEALDPIPYEALDSHKF